MEKGYVEPTVAWGGPWQPHSRPHGGGVRQWGQYMVPAPIGSVAPGALSRVGGGRYVGGNLVCISDIGHTGWHRGPGRLLEHARAHRNPIHNQPTASAVPLPLRRPTTLKLPGGRPTRPRWRESPPPVTRRPLHLLAAPAVSTPGGPVCRQGSGEVGPQLALRAVARGILSLPVSLSASWLRRLREWSRC